MQLAYIPGSFAGRGKKGKQIELGVGEVHHETLGTKTSLLGFWPDSRAWEEAVP